MEYGSFAPIVRSVCALFLLLSLGSGVRAESGTRQADAEAALLHRRIDLSGIQQWERSAASWQPLTLIPAKIYVVNLWSVYCPPCQKEFPLLRNLMKGWRSHPEVQFLFLADPPSDASAEEVAEFWKKNQAALPDTGPLRTVSAMLRQSIENDQNPITLLLDENLIVRQAFVGSIETRPIGRSIERLMQTSNHSFGIGKKPRLSSLHR